MDSLYACHRLDSIAASRLRYNSIQRAQQYRICPGSTPLSFGVFRERIDKKRSRVRRNTIDRAG